MSFGSKIIGGDSINEYLEKIENENEKYEKRKMIINISVVALIISLFTYALFSSHNSQINVKITSNDTVVTKQAKVDTTLSQFLDEENINIDNDYVKLNDEYVATEEFSEILLKNNDQITIEKVELKQEIVLEDIKYKTKTTTTQKLPIGESEVTQKGEMGQREITYMVKLYEGEVVDKTIVSNKVVKKPVDEVIAKGSKETIEDNYSPQDQKKEKPSNEQNNNNKQENDTNMNKAEEKEQVNTDNCIININGEQVPCSL